MPKPKLHHKSDHSALEERLQALLHKITCLHDQEIELSLDRVKRFLKQLGDPHLKLPPVIHIAGTNGKGSTLAILRSLLEASNKSVHVMTSPHLIHPTERIRLAGELISTKMLVDALEECIAINHDEPITFFEMFTAASFLAMSRVPADYTLLETGMGGRLDATNLIPHPLLTIITTLSKDHQEFLGDTLKDIAFEKAGIMKTDTPCVIGYQTDEAIQAGVVNVFHEVSQALSPEATLLQYGEAWFIEENHDQIKFTWQGESMLMSRPNLLGQHQVYNTGAALAAYRVIMGQDFDANILSPNNPKNPLGIIEWPGRLQKLENHYLNSLIPKNAELWLDGGHNDSAGLFLAEQARRWKEEDNKPLHLIVAMVDRKDPAVFLEPLLPYAESLTITEINGEPDSYKMDIVYKLIEPLGFKNVSMAQNTEMALQQITDKNARILITGSLYFIGTILT